MAISIQKAKAELERRRRQRSRLQIDAALSQIEFAKAYLYIQAVENNQKYKRSLVYTQLQTDFLNSLTGRDLALKPRQVGISTAAQSVLYRAATTQQASTITLAHDHNTTQELRRMADYYHSQDPRAPKRATANARVTTYPDYGSRVTMATAGNARSGRGFTNTHFHGSEVAYWTAAEDVVAGAMQGGNPLVILESTANGAQGYFFNLCMEALSGANDWTLHFWPWWAEQTYQLPLLEGEELVYTLEEGQLIEEHNLTPAQIKWRRVKQRELKHLFQQEYPESVLGCFLQSGAGYFGDVSGAFKAPMFSTWDPTHIYVAGLDFGQKNDYTVLCVIDATVGCQVALLRVNKLPWAEMRKRVIQLLLKWSVRTLVPETNSMGNTNIEALAIEMEASGCRTQMAPFTTNNTDKYLIMGNLHTALHEEHLTLIDEPVQRHELAAFAAEQLPSGAWRLSAPEGGHDDTVIALALAWHATTMMGWSEEDIRRIGTNTINVDSIGADLLLAAAMSGVDIEALRAAQQMIEAQELQAEILRRSIATFESLSHKEE